MKRIIIISLLLLTAAVCLGDFSGLNNGTRSLGMGNAFVAMSGTEEAVFYNAAGTAGIKQWSITSSYQNLYGISDLANLNLAAVYQNRNFAHAFCVQQINLWDVYNENIFMLNTSWKHELDTGRISTGINLKFHHLSGEDCDVELDQPFDLDFGLAYGYKGLRLGYSNKNVLRDNRVIDHIKSSHTVGLAFMWQDLLNYTLDYEIRPGKTYFRTGIELWFFDTFAPRMGFDDEHLTMGFGLKSSWWGFDFGMKAHEELGTSYRFGLNLILSEI